MTTKMCFMVTQCNRDRSTRWGPVNVLVVDRAGISSRRARLLDRLIAKWQAPQLDEELANGAPPESRFRSPFEPSALCVLHSAAVSPGA